MTGDFDIVTIVDFNIEMLNDVDFRICVANSVRITAHYLDNLTNFKKSPTK